MALILVVSRDAALVEGVSQTLSGAGHRVAAAGDMVEALDGLHGALPLVAVVNRNELLAPDSPSVPLARGGALVTFRGGDELPSPLPFRLRRATLADLQLPLERKRLLALVNFVETRARAAGREIDQPDLTAEHPSAD